MCGNCCNTKKSFKRQQQNAKSHRRRRRNMHQCNCMNTSLSPSPFNNNNYRNYFILQQLRQIMKLIYQFVIVSARNQFIPIFKSSHGIFCFELQINKKKSQMIRINQFPLKKILLQKRLISLSGSHFSASKLMINCFGTILYYASYHRHFRPNTC